MTSMALWYNEKEATCDLNHTGTNCMRNCRHGKRVRCSQNEKQQLVSAKVHFNLWVADSVNEEAFLDIGLLFNNIDVASKISFFIPAHVEKKDISDLGEIISESTLCNAIFNENYSVVKHSVSKHTQVRSEEDNELQFDIFALDIMKDIEVKHEYHGTIIEISTTAILNYKEPEMETYPRRYIRLRIKNKSFMNVLIKKHENKNNALESKISEKYTIDMRFNYNRSLDSSLLEAMNIDGKRKVEIERVDFLIMAKSDVDILSEGYKSARELEKKIWDHYVNEVDGSGLKEITEVVAYHWVNEPKGCNSYLDSWEKFVRYKRDKCTNKTILKYLFYFMILTVVCNLLTDGAKWIFTTVFSLFI